ncbi:MAG TPA: isochorismate synthase [Pseudonocardiaceae bacterium]|nr:isochorismate synthase [Pseudonocardiaceae bacterium]
MTIASPPASGPRSHSGRAPRAYSRTHGVDTATDLLGLLPTGEDALAWVREGEGVVGWGEVARFEPKGPGRFAEAAEWWRDFVAQLDVTDEVELPGTGPLAFVSMAFADEPGHSVLIVPEVVVGRRDGRTWITEIGTDGGPGAGLHAVKPVEVPSGVRYEEGQLSVPAYREAVAKAVTRLRASDGNLGKVVLAHDLVATVPPEQGPIDVRYLLHALAARHPNCWTFSVDGLVGATPELLLRRTGSGVSARVLAGTVWPHDDVDPETLAADLLSSAKNKSEHRYAVESLAGSLRPFCAALSVPDEPVVLRLRNVLHLATDVRGTLTEDVSLLTLAEAAHPTAAVGGTPREAAVALIAELEGMDRGRYAGPVGWVDGSGDGEFGIALRCAQVSDNTVRMFAGCGIVADSDPDSEVVEANAKLVPMREAMENVR